MDAHTPYTIDASPAGRAVSRNTMRLRLWADPVFAHRWMCHPDSECADGCDAAPIPSRAALYQSEIEAA